MFEIPEYLLQGKGSFFVCSRSVLRAQVEALKGIGLEIFYSVKTNPEKCILEELNKLEVGFSVSNYSEFLSVISLGAKPEKIIYYERGLTAEKAKKVAEAGCRNFVIESEAAFKNLAPLLGKGFSVLLRIKANGEDKGAYAGKYKPGLEARDAIRLKKDCEGLGTVSGFMHHSSSQMERASDWQKKFEYLSTLSNTDIIDIGGGMPISYNGTEDNKVLGEIKKGIKKLKAKRIIAEPGRFIVGPACSLVAKVELADGESAVLDCSVYNVHIDTIIADLVLPCQVLRGGGGTMHKYRLLGSSLCNLDVFNPGVRLPELKAGDFMVFEKAGAYNFSSDFGSGSGIKTYIVD